MYTKATALHLMGLRLACSKFSPLNDKFASKYVSKGTIFSAGMKFSKMF